MTDKKENPFGPPLTFQAYADKAMTYRLDTADEIYARENLAAEVGELLSLFAKARRDHPNGFGVKAAEDFRRFVKKEIGDVLWHLQAIAEDNGTTLEECALLNLVKLRDRAERGVIQGSGDER